MKRKHGPGRTAAFDVGNVVFLGVLAFLMIYPFWEMLVLSISPATQASGLGFKVIPTGFTLEAYRAIFDSKVIGYGYVNTVLRTVVGTAVAVFLYFCTAYPLAKRSLPARGTLTVFYLIPMFFGGGLIPEFLLVKGLGLFDTVWALILPCLLGTYNLLIMRNFLMTIPESLEESARVDGANVFTILVTIGPIVATYPFLQKYFIKGVLVGSLKG